MALKRLAMATMLLLAATAVGRWPSAVHSQEKAGTVEFRTSDRCMACHVGLKTGAGEDVSIGFDWRASLMANSSRDPYWQASVRRETLEHAPASAAIEDECSSCHMPVVHLEAKARGERNQVFSHLPFASPARPGDAAADGVTCTVCHQAEKQGLGSKESFNGNLSIGRAAAKADRPEYGPFVVDAGHQRIMRSSTGGYLPVEGEQVRDSALCGSCHTLYTKALDAGGKEIGTLPEQMPYLEWQHSDYRDRQSCQSCHMPEVEEPVAITAIFGQQRSGMRRHQFVGANFVMEKMLLHHRDELGVAALPAELEAANRGTYNFVRSQSARVSIERLAENGPTLRFDVLAQNLTGHKLPTAYPSRRAWLHVVVKDGAGQTIFESGAINPDGSIVGNENDLDRHRFTPHFREISNAQQVEIFEPILGDANQQVTTGLLSATAYLKDNRLLPSGFDKKTAARDVAVVGDAARDPRFTDKGSVTRYAVDPGTARGPFRIEAELWYQPIGYRWAHNLEGISAAEPQRFVRYFEAEAHDSAVVLASASSAQ